MEKWATSIQNMPSRKRRVARCVSVSTPPREACARARERGENCEVVREANSAHKRMRNKAGARESTRRQKKEGKEHTLIHTHAGTRRHTAACTGPGITRGELE